MRRAITLARPHGKQALQIVQDNTVPFEKQLREFKSCIAAGKSHPQFAEMQLWVSDKGIAKRAKFSDPKADAKAEAAAAKAAAEKEAEEKAEAAAREAAAKAAAEKEAAEKEAAEKSAAEEAARAAARATANRQRGR